MIVDFSRSLGQVTTTTKGSLAFWSPELLIEEGIVTQSKESDVWAFGMTIYVRYGQILSLSSLHLTLMTKELVSRKRPFEGLRDFQVIQAITQGKTPSFPSRPESSIDVVQESLKDVCRRCWTNNPTLRPRMQDIVSDLRPGRLFLCKHQSSAQLQNTETETTSESLNLKRSVEW